MNKAIIFKISYLFLLLILLPEKYSKTFDEFDCLSFEGIKERRMLQFFNQFTEYK